MKHTYIVIVFLCVLAAVQATQASLEIPAIITVEATKDIGEISRIPANPNYPHKP